MAEEGRGGIVASELNANYDEDSLYCPECSQYWTRCECVAVAALAAEWREDSIAEDEANSLEENRNEL